MGMELAAVEPTRLTTGGSFTRAHSDAGASVYQHTARPVLLLTIAPNRAVCELSPM